MTLSRRDLLRGALKPPAPARPRRGSAQVEHIPLTWVLPRESTANSRLVLWLAGGIAGMNAASRELDALADEGFTAVSFDSWRRGTRAREPMNVFFPRSMANFARVTWPMIGNAALEALRVLDWAAAEFDLQPPFFVGGHSLGGDAMVAAAGLDARIGCVAAVTATPDWLRPGMRADGLPVEPGEPDAYAQWFYDQMNPMTHLASFSHRPAIAFECGEADEHVPAEAALRFKSALEPAYGQARDRLRVIRHPSVAHEYTPEMWQNCMAWFREQAQASAPT